MPERRRIEQLKAALAAERAARVAAEATLARWALTAVTGEGDLDGLGRVGPPVAAAHGHQPHAHQ